MSVIHTIVDFTTDKTRRLSTRAAVIIISLCTVLIINNLTGFTYYLNINNKIENLNQIKELLQDSTLSKQQTEEIKHLRGEIIKRESWIESAGNYFNEIFIHSDPKYRSPHYIAQLDVYRGSWSYFLSATWFGLLLLLCTPFLLLNDKSLSTGQAIMQTIGVEIFFIVCTWLIWFLLGLIPLFNEDKLAWNYALNVFLNLILFVALWIYGNKTKQKVASAFKEQPVNKM